MQSRLFLSLVSAATLLAGAASAGEAIYGHAKLVTPLSAAKSEVQGGLTWKCDGDACVATGDEWHANWSAMYACRKVAGSFGALASYSSSGIEMSAGNLGVCNKAAAGGAQTAAK